MSEVADRNAEIERLHLEELLDTPTIGREMGISGERVRQILRQRGVTPQETRIIGRIRRTHRWRCEVCGLEEWRYGARENTTATCGGDCGEAHRRDRLRGRAIPEDDLLEELRVLADEIGVTPSGDDMTADGQYAHTTYFNRFGSWRNACIKAGLDPNPRGAPGHKDYQKAEGATP